MASTAPSTNILNGYPIRNFDTNDPGATAWANDIKGGHHQYQTLVERDAIPTERREIGMLCSVLDTGLTYRLEGALDNSGWSDIFDGVDTSISEVQDQVDDLNIRVSSVEMAQANGHIGYLNLSDLYADLAPDEGALGEVTNDPDIENNGVYIKIGSTGTGSWQKSDNGIYADVAELKATVAQDIIPDSEYIEGIAAAWVDVNRRPWMEFLTSGETKITLSDDSIPIIDYSHLSSDVKQFFPEADDYNGIAAAWVDVNRRPWMKFMNSGRVDILLENGTVDNDALVDASIEGSKIKDDTLTYDLMVPDVKIGLPVPDDFSGYIWVLRDSNGRPLLRFRNNGEMIAVIPGIVNIDAVIEEVETARGTTPSLNDRLSKIITPAGLSDVAIWGTWFLRSWVWKRTQLEIPAVIRCNIAFVGDSWTQNSGRLVREIAVQLANKLGDGGGGFMGFGFLNDSGGINGSADSSRLSGTRDTGVWTDVYNIPGGVFSMDAIHIRSSTVGAGVTVYAGTAHTSLRIHYRIHPGGGVFRYRFGSGSWTSVDTDGSSAYGLENLVLPGPTFTLRIEVLSAGSAGVILDGVDGGTASGVTIHKLGLSGGMASSFTAVPNDYWETGLAALEVDTVAIMFATNEMNGNVAPSTLAANVGELIQRVRAARPLADIVLMCPAANGLTGKTYTMAQYRDAIYSEAYASGAAFLDYTKVFGEYSTYKYSTDGSTRNLFNADGIHPEPATGGKVLSDAFLRLLYFSN